MSIDFPLSASEAVQSSPEPTRHGPVLMRLAEEMDLHADRMAHRLAPQNGRPIVVPPEPDIVTPAAILRAYADLVRKIAVEVDHSDGVRGSGEPEEPAGDVLLW